MRFRPCIDIHNGKVKQIVGGSLRDAGSAAKENFVAEQDAAFYAEFYKRDGLRGGHVILLNPAGSDYYEADEGAGSAGSFRLSRRTSAGRRGQCGECRSISGYGSISGDRDLLCF